MYKKYIAIHNNTACQDIQIYSYTLTFGCCIPSSITDTYQANFSLTMHIATYMMENIIGYNTVILQLGHIILRDNITCFSFPSG